MVHLLLNIAKMVPNVNQKTPSSFKKGKGGNMRKYFVLVVFLASLISCAGKGNLTRKDLIEVGKELQPQHSLRYRKVVVEETLEITNIEKRGPVVVKRKREKKEEAPKQKKVRIYKISEEEGGNL